MTPLEPARPGFEAPFASLASEVFEGRLPNGLRLLVREVYPSQVTSVFFWVRSGAGQEPPHLSGAAHFLEHLLFKGHSRQSGGGGLAQRVRRRGGYLNGFTAHDYTCLWAVFPGGRHLDMLLEVGAESVFTPSFRNVDVDQERRVILQELRTHHANPSAFCLHRLLEAAYPDHPYGRSILGDPESLRSMNSEALREYHEAHYFPGNVTLVVVGQVSVERCLERALALVGQGDRRPSAPRSACPQPWGAAQEIELTGDIRAPHLMIAFPVPDWQSPHLPACDILATVLGRGRSSRLYQGLRERQSLANTVSCELFLGRDPGLLLLRMVLSGSDFAAPEREVAEQIDSLRQGRLDPQEVLRARNLVETAYVFTHETVEGQGRKLGYHDVMGDYRRAEDYARRLAEVDVEQVIEAARVYLDPARRLRVRYRPKSP